MLCFKAPSVFVVWGEGLGFSTAKSSATTAANYLSAIGCPAGRTHVSSTARLHDVSMFDRWLGPGNISLELRTRFGSTI